MTDYGQTNGERLMDNNEEDDYVEEIEGNAFKRFILSCCGGTEDDDDKNLITKAPSPLRIGDYICLTIMTIILLNLVAFIIYISATWNKDRTNEYT